MDDGMLVLAVLLAVVFVALLVGAVGEPWDKDLLRKDDNTIDLTGRRW